MRTLKLSAVPKLLAEYARALDDEIVVLTARNKPVAAIVPLRHVDRESLSLSAHPGVLRIIARARREFAEGKKLSLEEMKRAVLPPRRSRGRRSDGATRRRPRPDPHPQHAGLGRGGAGRGVCGNPAGPSRPGTHGTALPHPLRRRRQPDPAVRPS